MVLVHWDAVTAVAVAVAAAVAAQVRFQIVGRILKDHREGSLRDLILMISFLG